MGAPAVAPSTTSGHRTQPRSPGSSLYHQYHHHELERQGNQNPRANGVVGPEPATDASVTHTTTADITNNSGNRRDGITTTSGDLEATYTSLIQEYLQVMCIDNATFLAERMVATFPDSSNARYLLGVCHYRACEPRRALAVLETARDVPSPAASYVMAKCCFDLKEYNRAEEILLQAARKGYKEYKSSAASAAEQQQHGSTAETSVMSIDEWLVETSPCTIPNGAAGLYLLGRICRESTRKQRAMDYFRMSLQVRGFLGVSFGDED